MKEIFSKFNIELKENQIERFNIYLRTLLEYNEKFNITAITDENEIKVKHFLDSAIGIKYIEGKKSLIDIGSGGGFPAVPLKILNEELSVTLVEATEKKCEFLRELGRRLQLNKFKVINARAEELSFNDEYREKFDVCSARAVARLNILSEYCLPFVKKGGIFIAYKGDGKEELLEAENGIKILGGKVKVTEEYELSGAKRSLIVIEKIKNTEKKYPRKNGQIRKRPL